VFHTPSFSIGLLLGAAIVLITGYLPELLAPPVEAPPQVAGSKPGTEQAPSQQLRFEFDRILRTTAAPVVVDPANPAVATDPLADGAFAVAGRPGRGAGERYARPGGRGCSCGATGRSADRDHRHRDRRSPARGDRQPPLRPSPPYPSESEAEADQPPVTTSEPPPTAQPRGGYMLQAASFRSRAEADRLRAQLLLSDLPASIGEVSVDNSVWYRVTVGPFPDEAATDVARERLRERNLTAIPFRR
jgi:cell division septation protein DedD